MSLKDRREREERSHIGGKISPNGGFGAPKIYGRKRRSIAGPVVIACAVIAVLVAANYLMNSGKIYSGVEVGDVALGGKTPAEARRIVEERARSGLKEIEFSGPGQFTRTAKEMGVSFNADATVKRAYAVGREGNILDRLGERARALIVGVAIPAEVDYRPEKARPEVEEIASRVNHAPKEASVNVYGSQVEVVESHKGYKLDIPATMKSFDSAIEDMSGRARLVGDMLKPEITTQEARVAAEKARAAVSEQLVFKAQGHTWTLSPADVGSALDITRDGGRLEVSLNRDRLRDRLAKVYADLNVPPVWASYAFDSSGNIIVRPSKEGQKIEDHKFLGAIEHGLFQGKREYDVPVVVDKPKYTTAELQRLKPTKLLGSYRTNYTATSDHSQARVDNLKMASNAISGTFLAPGQVFSMIDTVSGVNFNKTHVIINGQETTADGGGLCQVTSTLYNAALYAGLEVVERHPHYSQLPYIRPGMDATVWFGDQYGNGALDMKFKNTTDGYVLLREYVANDNYIYAQVYGVPDNVSVKMWSEPVYRYENSSKWLTYYKRMKGGKVVYKDKWYTEYGALIGDNGKKFPTPEVPVAEVNGTYNGPPIPSE